MRAKSRVLLVKIKDKKNKIPQKTSLNRYAISVNIGNLYGLPDYTCINKRYGHTAHTFSRLLSDILTWEIFYFYKQLFRMTDNNTFLAVSPANLMT